MSIRLQSIRWLVTPTAGRLAGLLGRVQFGSERIGQLKRPSLTSLILMTETLRIRSEEPKKLKSYPIEVYIARWLSCLLDCRQAGGRAPLLSSNNEQFD